VLDKSLLLVFNHEDIVIYMFQKTMREIDVGTERLLWLHLTLSIKGLLLK
jgi:hypothetical protein